MREGEAPHISHGDRSSVIETLRQRETQLQSSSGCSCAFRSSASTSRSAAEEDYPLSGRVCASKPLRDKINGRPLLIRDAQDALTSPITAQQSTAAPVSSHFSTANGTPIMPLAIACNYAVGTWLQRQGLAWLSRVQRNQI